MSAKFNPQELFEILQNEELDCQSVDATEIVKNFPEMLTSLCLVYIDVYMLVQAGLSVIMD